MSTLDQDLASLLHGLDEAYATNNIYKSSFRTSPLDDVQFMLRIVVAECQQGFPIRRCQRECQTLFLSHVNDSSDSFSELIEMACDDADAIKNAGVIQILQVENYSMETLPNNLHRLFPNVKSVQIVNCPRFLSLSTAVSQFGKLKWLSCEGCESLASLKTLSSLPIESHLQAIVFCRCGLRVTSDDDWAPGMEALARLGTNTSISEEGGDYIHITISSCDSLDRIPASIGKLSETAKDMVLLYLKRNNNLVHLPHVLGEIPKLNTLVIESCPKITRLPWSLSRTAIDLSNMCALISSLGLTSQSNDFAPFFTIDPGTLDPYFKVYRRRFCRGLFRLAVLVGRARKRAIHRLCVPGGTWYERSRQSFLSAASAVSCP